MSRKARKNKINEAVCVHTMYFIVPCYNEVKTLPLTVPFFVKKMRELRREGKISEKSKILLIDDGSRDTFAGDNLIKRATSSIYYYLLRLAGISVIKNHADFRLVSRRAMWEMDKFDHPELFLRGCFSMMDLKKSLIRYKCGRRVAGRSVFSIKKMLELGINGVIFFIKQ